MSSASALNSERKAGSATPEGTLRYAARFQGRAAPGHFREIPGGLVLSSIGIGTYLGEADAATDGAYTDAVVAAVESGCNSRRFSHQLPLPAKRASRRSRSKRALLPGFFPR